MKNELPDKGQRELPLDARFASRPHVRARLHAIADMMDQAITEGATADKAEAMAIEELRELGGDVLTDRAQQKQTESVRTAQKENPSAIRHIKKVKWFSTYGAIEVEEQICAFLRSPRLPAQQSLLPTAKPSLTQIETCHSGSAMHPPGDSKLSFSLPSAKVGVAAFMTSLRKSIFLGCSCAGLALPAFAAENVMLTEVPDYSWYAGCFGTSGGNLMGYWDRHGFPNFYTGPTAGGVAPLDSRGSNIGIRSLWASRAGFDGRPADQPGHIDNYWEFYLDSVSYSYESTAPDPYITEGRPEHAPDCLGDFMGASQNKWTDLDGECTGNIDAFGFTYWDKQGDRRLNFVPPPQGTNEVRDVPSGMKAWTQFKGYDAEVFSQLVDFNPTIPAGKGFTFQDLKTEIDAGYPVILFLQNPNELNRPLPGMPRANPRVHAMLAYGYVIDDNGEAYVRYMTSWGSSGDFTFTKWEPIVWQTLLTLRGVIGYRPLPKIVHTERADEGMKVTWHGPASHVFDFLAGTTTPVHWYVVEKADSLTNPAFTQVTEPTSSNEAIIEDFTAEKAFYRVRLLSHEESAELRQ